VKKSSNIAKGGEIWSRDWDFNPFADHMVEVNKLDSIGVNTNMYCIGN
jgi:hypothetical protein